MSTRVERLRLEDLLLEIDRAESPCDDGSAALLLSITQGAAGKVCQGNPVAVDAAEAEGSTPTFAADGSVLVSAVNLGTGDPTGKYVICHATGGRLVFRYDA